MNTNNNDFNCSNICSNELTLAVLYEHAEYLTPKEFHELLQW